MITAQEVKELNAMSQETLIYELLEFVENYFKPASQQSNKYCMSKLLVISDLLRQTLTSPFEVELDD